jgi:tRNA nucleotidyltransferase/poly(A) polymerase
MGRAHDKIYRVILDRHIFDISSLSGSTLEDDLKQRDFTINAMAYDLSSAAVIDCVGGLKDLADGCVRMVSGTIFEKDPIRLLRAYRMSACFAFDIEKNTLAAIKREAPRISDVAGERIRTEFFKILDSAKSYEYLFQMADSGLLTAIFPDLLPLIGCIQNERHAYDVFAHTMAAYQHLEAMMNDPGGYFPDSVPPLRQTLKAKMCALLKCSILFHDLGKPRVKSVDDVGLARFYDHANKSADMAKKISRQLKLSVSAGRFIDFIVRNHMKPLFMFNAHRKKTLKPKTIVRFFIEGEDNLPYLLLHAAADAKAKQTGKTNQDFILFVKDLMHDFFHRFKPMSEKPRLVTGHDLIDLFALTPSPLFKSILDRVEEARLANQIHSRAEALALVKNLLNS